MGHEATGLLVLVLGAPEDDVLAVTLSKGHAPHDTVVLTVDNHFKWICFVLAGGHELLIGRPGIGGTVPPHANQFRNLRFRDRNFVLGPHMRLLGTREIVDATPDSVGANDASEVSCTVAHVYLA